MPRNRHSGIRNVQESTKLSRINPSYLEPFLDTSPRSNPVHLNTSNLFSTNTLTTELVIISTMDKTPTFISAFEAFLTQNPPQNDNPKILKVSTCYNNLSIPLKTLKRLSNLIKMY